MSAPLCSPPPPPAPPPTFGLLKNGSPGLASVNNGSTTASSKNLSPSTADRSNLLNEIRKAGGAGGRIQLKKAVTNDRSAPVVGNGSKNSPTPASAACTNGPVLKASNVTPNGAFGTKSTNSTTNLSFQEQLSRAVLGGTKLGGGSISTTKTTTSQIAIKSDAPRPLPPTPVSGKFPTPSSSTPSTKIPEAARSSSPKPTLQNTTTLGLTPQWKSQQTSATFNLKSQAPGPPTTPTTSIRLRSTTPPSEPARMSNGQVSSRIQNTFSRCISPPNQKVTHASSNQSGESNLATKMHTTPTLPSNAPVAPPPPIKPPHLTTGGRPLAPPPPPSRPPSQKPEVEKVFNKQLIRTHADFGTIGPHTANKIAGLLTTQQQQQPLDQSTCKTNESNSDENLISQKASHKIMTHHNSNPNRPAPPPPPQRPPPLPPSGGGRPGVAPPPPPPSTTTIRKANAGSFNNANFETAPPPPPPPRTDSLVSDFERRFIFRTTNLLPIPEKFQGYPKSYPDYSKNPRRSGSKFPTVVS